MRLSFSSCATPRPRCGGLFLALLALELGLGFPFALLLPWPFDLVPVYFMARRSSKLAALILRRFFFLHRSATSLVQRNSYDIVCSAIAIATAAICLQGWFYILADLGFHGRVVLPSKGAEDHHHHHHQLEIMHQKSIYKPLQSAGLMAMLSTQIIDRNRGFKGVA
jgi:hypothetical protein